MALDKTDKTFIGFGVAIVIFVVLGSFVMVKSCGTVASEINKVGLKSIVEQVWHGEGR